MPTEAIEQRDLVRSPEQMQELLDQLDSRGYKLDRLDQHAQAAEQQEELVHHLRDLDPALNGNVDHLIEDLQLYRQETAAKKEWSTWEYLKQIPSRVWETMKAHPAITTAVMVSALLAGAYYSGLAAPVIGRIRDWLLLQMGGSQVAEAAGAAGAAAEKAAEAAGAAAGQAADAAGAAAGQAAEAGTAAAESAVEAAEGVGEGLKQAAEGVVVPPEAVPVPEPLPPMTPPPPATPLPTEVPRSLEEADSILRSFERGTGT